MTQDIKVEAVTFPSEGTTCAGDLYILHDGVEAPRPGIVLGHGFGSVKEKLVEQGNFFAQAGYAALAIDYRTFGLSEGEPRGRCSRFKRSRTSATASATCRPDPKSNLTGSRSGGRSFGGAIVLYTAAVDRRVKAVVAQAPIVDGGRWMRALRTTEQWQDLLNRLDDDRAKRFAGEPSEQVPIVGHGAAGEFAAMPADRVMVDWLMGFTQRFAPTWRPTLALESVEKVIEFNPTDIIDQIAPRALCVIAMRGYDIIHPIEHIVEAYDRALDPKRIEFLDFDQIGAYSGEGLQRSLECALAFLQEHLPADSTYGGTPATTDLRAMIDALSEQGD